MFLMTCLKTVVERIINSTGYQAAMGGTDSSSTTQGIYLHLFFFYTSQAIISCFRNIRGLSFGLHMVGIVFYIWTPYRVYGVLRTSTELLVAEYQS